MAIQSPEEFSKYNPYGSHLYMTYITNTGDALIAMDTRVGKLAFVYRICELQRNKEQRVIFERAMRKRYEKETHNRDEL